MPAQGLHFEDMQAAGDGKGADEFTEFDHLDALDADFQDLPQRGREGVADEAGKLVIDDLQGRHPFPDNPVLIGQVIGNHPRISRLIRFGWDRSLLHPKEEGIDFFLR